MHKPCVRRDLSVFNARAGFAILGQVSMYIYIYMYIDTHIKVHVIRMANKLFLLKLGAGAPAIEVRVRADGKPGFVPKPSACGLSDATLAVPLPHRAWVDY